MADKHTRLYSGYLIPVPQAKGDNMDKRTCYGFLWGDATGDAVVSHKSDSRKDAEGATPKCTVVFKAAKTTFKVSVTTKSMWFDALRHIKKGDRCLVCGIYNEVDKVGKTGREYTRRKFQLGFFFPALAATDPREWQKRLDEEGDPLLSANDHRRRGNPNFGADRRWGQWQRR